ncbi:putative efflux pump [Xylaria arbuscula]|uniref:Major facilitator superfamily (MFS) profile domain-containing protein n=1 Tax=Xylaria arbuscula TaxID=114810 RepID=A0A9W8TNP6_9PEZI|nr:putative efflux pump [Xylaria arbuscula]KAJ3578077.1 hypothetical protein NPX13_g2487 [Xylaria arbuscula]
MPTPGASLEAMSQARTIASSSDSSVDRGLVSPITPSGAVAPEKGGSPDLSRYATPWSDEHPVGDGTRQVETSEDDTEYPSGVKFVLITVALCLSVFLMALDNSIIATAIPKITETFHSLSDVGWYGSAYLLTTAALQLLFGKFYSFLSVKRVYLVAIALFELGSLICGVAQNSVTLIIGRAIAGLGSAGIFTGTLLILAHSVPLAKRPIYSGFIGSTYGIASVAGPLLGGVFTDKATWRWCFYINLPIGAVTLVIIAFFLSDPVRKQVDSEKQRSETFIQRINRFDPIGTVLFMPGIISLLLALQWGGTTYAWSNGRIIALFVVFGILIIAFLYVQYLQQENATVPPRIFASRSVYSSSLFIFALGASFFSFVYYVPIWLQAVQGVSAVESGIRNLPMLLGVVVFSILAGGIVTGLGYYAPVMIIGSILAAIGSGLLTTWTPDTSKGAWIGYQIIYGAGAGLALQQPLIAVQASLDIKDVPVGTAVVIFAQTIGGTLFISVSQNIFTNSLVKELAVNVPTVDPAAVIAAGATNLQRAFPPELISGVVLSYNNALTTAFFVGVATAVLSAVASVLIEWKSVKGKNIEMVGG